MAKTLNPIAALLLSVALMLLGHGLQATLLPVRADLEGFSPVAIGVMSSSYFGGFVLGCVMAPFAVLRAGHIRAFAALVSLGSASAILYPVLAEPFAWSIIRFAYGFTLAGFYLIVESWLNERATNENRGALMSTYIIVNLAAITGGQMLLTAIDPGGFTAFVLASVAVSLAVVPISLTRSQQPAPITLVRFQPMKLYRISPAAFVGSLFIGLANGTNWTLAPLYARQIGFDKADVAYFASAIIFGGALGQWPIGRLSDRMDRRVVLIGLAFASGIVAGLIAGFEPTTSGLAIASAGLLGFFAQPAYSIAAAHAFDHVESDGFVEASSGLLLANGIGSTIGPVLASIVMVQLGPSGLYAMVSLVMFLLAAYVLFRMQVREAPAARLHTEFDLAGTAQVGGVLTPELFDESHPNVVLPEFTPAPYTPPDPETVAEAWETAWDDEEAEALPPEPDLEPGPKCNDEPAEVPAVSEDLHREPLKQE
ncbi:MFS transporter [Breoghania sp.]|uniref:MFS transporter n=1 Tax=Breoghania sp. TaxID=2065378 RepID=UPI0029CA42A4|nr:MFS transporter [Breoghania sp.]